MLVDTLRILSVAFSRLQSFECRPVRRSGQPSLDLPIPTPAPRRLRNLTTFPSHQTRRDSSPERESSPWSLADYFQSAAALADEISLLTNVRIVRHDIHCPTENAMVLYSKLLRLAELHLSIPDFSDFSSTVGFAPGSFPSLERLQIRGKPRVVAQVVSNVTSPLLAFLSIEICPTGMFMALPFEACIFPRSLTSFSLEWSNPCSFGSPLNLASLRRLSDCPLLENVSIHAFGSVMISVNDNDITTMATAWPNIQSLSIAQTTPHRPLTTLASLQALAKHCPLLQRVQIAVDASVGSTEVIGRSHLQLRSLNLGCSPCGQIDSIVGFIKGMFPCLQTLGVDDWACDANGGVQGNWAAVRQDLLGLG